MTYFTANLKIRSTLPERLIMISGKVNFEHALAEHNC